jgi:putative acetyltransferase
MKMLQPYVVRRLSLADVPAMVSIIESTRHEYGVHRRTQQLLEPADLDLHTTYQEPRSDYFVATYADVVAGGGGIAPLDGADEETCELQRMYLGARHRRLGVGRLLLKECLRRAARMGFRRCYAETISEMKEAIRSYEAHGFRRLSAPLGIHGHEHTDCWLILDLERSTASSALHPAPDRRQR